MRERAGGSAQPPGVTILLKVVRLWLGIIGQCAEKLISDFGQSAAHSLAGQGID